MFLEQNQLVLDQWVCCLYGKGCRYESGNLSERIRHFPANSIGMVKLVSDTSATVWIIGTDETWEVPLSDLSPIDVLNTGDKFNKKICNICHRLLPINQFQPNQNNKHGIIRRPSCKQCRTNIDKRAPKSTQAKRAEKNRPQKGSAFRCPICQKRSIVGITAKIVADHDHHTGDIRDFICDSCNTGLGRFKNGHDCLRDAIAYLEERG